MKPTVQYLRQRFNEYNAQMFNGTLPAVPIVLVDVKTFLGACEHKKRLNESGEEEKHDFILKFSTRIELPEQELEDVIIHELIHYYIGVNQLKDSSAHGPLFCSIMESINQRFGRHLTISHKNTKAQAEQAVDKTAHYHVIATVQYNDGKYGIKVLPRVISSIVQYYNAYAKIANVELYMSNNPYFNKYPCSSALRIHLVDEQEVKTNLQGSEPLMCDGKTISRTRRS